MSDAPTAATIRAGFASEFGDTEAERWTRCVGALPLPESPSLDDLGLALIMWATNLDDLAKVRGVLDTFTLLQVQVVGEGQSLVLSASDALSSPVLRTFIQRTATQAAGAFLASRDHRDSLANLSVRDDDVGQSGADFYYQTPEYQITAYYGDALAQSRVLNMRMLSGHALRSVVEGPAADPVTVKLDPAPVEGHGVGATGPVLEAA